MDFRSYFLGLTADERAAYAEAAGSTVATLIQVAYGNKDIELGFADALVAAAGGPLDIRQMPLTLRARRQDAIRCGRVALGASAVRRLAQSQKEPGRCTS